MLIAQFSLNSNRDQGLSTHNNFLNVNSLHNMSRKKNVKIKHKNYMRVTITYLENKLSIQKSNMIIAIYLYWIFPFRIKIFKKPQIKQFLFWIVMNVVCKHVFNKYWMNFSSRNS